ncbi:unnamed protein product [Somion occarium]|uniref:Secreted protein n=1 Tax=Somion occarium TaxID=3059160 RepID=A0ABP1E7P5_9APHY
MKIRRIAVVFQTVCGRALSQGKMYHCSCIFRAYQHLDFDGFQQREICYFCHSEVCAKASPYAFCAISVEGFRSSDESKPTSHGSSTVVSVHLCLLMTNISCVPSSKIIMECLIT